MRCACIRHTARESHANNPNTNVKCCKWNDNEGRNQMSRNRRLRLRYEWVVVTQNDVAKSINRLIDRRLHSMHQILNLWLHIIIWISRQTRALACRKTQFRLNIETNGLSGGKPFIYTLYARHLSCGPSIDPNYTYMISCNCQPLFTTHTHAHIFVLRVFFWFAMPWRSICTHVSCNWKCMPTEKPECKCVNMGARDETRRWGRGTHIHEYYPIFINIGK